MKKTKLEGMEMEAHKNVLRASLKDIPKEELQKRELELGDEILDLENQLASARQEKDMVRSHIGLRELDELKAKKNKQDMERV